MGWTSIRPRRAHSWLLCSRADSRSGTSRRRTNTGRRSYTAARHKILPTIRSDVRENLGGTRIHILHPDPGKKMQNGQMTKYRIVM